MTRAPRILILRGGAIGDFIVTLPVLGALRARWPDAEIDLIGYPHIARLALTAGGVRRVYSLDRAGVAQLFVPNPRVDPGLRALISDRDVVLNFLHDPDGQVTRNLCECGPRRVLYQSPVGMTEHAADHLLRILESLAMYEQSAIPTLTAGAAEAAAGRAWLEQAGCFPRPFAVHVGSGSPSKNWPLDRFFRIARTQADAGWRPFFIIGEADREWVPAIQAAARGPILEGVGLPELAGVLSHAQGYVGNDSGITHLAAALGVPVVAIFGPTDPVIWSPRGRSVALVRAPTGRLEDVAPDHVLGTIRALTGH